MAGIVDGAGFYYDGLDGMTVKMIIFRVGKCLDLMDSKSGYEAWM